MRRLRSAALAILALASMAPSYPARRDAPWPDMDYCGPYVERAMNRKSTACGTSTPKPFSPSQADIASRVSYGTIGLEEAVIVGREGAAVSPATGLAVIPDLCFEQPYGYKSWNGALTYMQQVAAESRNAALSPIRWGIWQRFDLAYYSDLATVGFDPAWIVGTSEPWANVTARITGDSGTMCTAQTCTFPMNFGSTQHQVSAYIDAIPPATADRYKGKVMYLPHLGPQYSCTKDAGTCTGGTNNGKACGNTTSAVDPLVPYSCTPGGGTCTFCAQHPAPVAALANLGNAAYRAWKLQRIKDGWQIVKGVADAIELTWKPGQYMCRGDFNAGAGNDFHASQQWLGGQKKAVCHGESATFANMDAWYANQDTPWTAQPTAYTWSTYVQGFKAMTDGLRAAGIPYQIQIDLLPWWLSDGGWGGRAADNCGGVGGVKCAFYDDPSTTTVNENDLVLSIYRGAKRVFYDKLVNNYDMAAESAMLADLRGRGVEVVHWTRSCGPVAEE